MVSDVPAADPGRREFQVAVLMQRRPPSAAKAWLGEAWRVTGVVVNSRLEAAGGSRVRSGPEGDDYLWSGFTLRLYKDEVESYYYNLVSERPSVYVVTTQDDQGTPRPFLVSASFDEANAYLESGGAVEAVPMPPELYPWVEHYVLAHYAPERRVKRKRHDWKEADDEPG